MWKRWETVTESERDKIAEIADRYEVPIRDVASMFQSGLNFDKINNNLAEVEKMYKATNIDTDKALKAINTGFGKQ